MTYNMLIPSMLILTLQVSYLLTEGPRGPLSAFVFICRHLRSFPNFVDKRLQESPRAPGDAVLGCLIASNGVKKQPRERGEERILDLNGHAGSQDRPQSLRTLCCVAC